MPSGWHCEAFAGYSPRGFELHRQGLLRLLGHGVQRRAVSKVMPVCGSCVPRHVRHGPGGQLLRGVAGLVVLAFEGRGVAGVSPGIESLLRRLQTRCVARQFPAIFWPPRLSGMTWSTAKASGSKWSRS